jgi:hypothetical protein
MAFVFGSVRFLLLALSPLSLHPRGRIGRVLDGLRSGDGAGRRLCGRRRGRRRDSGRLSRVRRGWRRRGRRRRRDSGRRRRGLAKRRESARSRRKRSGVRRRRRWRREEIGWRRRGRVTLRERARDRADEREDQSRGRGDGVGDRRTYSHGIDSGSRGAVIVDLTLAAMGRLVQLAVVSVTRFAHVVGVSRR